VCFRASRAALLWRNGIPGTIALSTFLGDFIEYEVLTRDGQTLLINEYTKDVAGRAAGRRSLSYSLRSETHRLIEPETEEVVSAFGQ
jgi:iron(III) transport system ATP-binding protein